MKHWGAQSGLVAYAFLTVPSYVQVAVAERAQSSDERFVCAYPHFNVNGVCIPAEPAAIAGFCACNALICAGSACSL